MDFDQAVEVANTAVFAKFGRHLGDVETAILKGAWQNQTYEQIAESSGYSVSYLTRDAGPKLWKLLSQACGEPVSKTNFQAMLDRHGREADAELQPATLKPLKDVNRATSAPTPQAQLPPPPASCPLCHCDWGEAPDVSLFYGRTQERLTLQHWIQVDRCRVVVLLGMGGIGKTALSVKLAQQLSEQNKSPLTNPIQNSKFNTQNSFQFLIWRSLRTAPSLTAYWENWCRLCQNNRIRLPR